MPLRDHFHPPVSKRSSWEGFHGLWPGIIVQELAPRLPDGFVAEPRAHLGNFSEQYAYEILIFDLERERRLVAAVEIVSPANKDRPESRQLFVARCFHLLRQDVCVSMIDLVTIHQFNLYTELLALVRRSDPTFTPPPPIYAVTCRKREVGRHTKLDTWSRPLAIGQPLPSLPVRLSETQTVSLDLEATYQETCRVLRIP
jgi:hypothetical protein